MQAPTTTTTSANTTTPNNLNKMLSLFRKSSKSSSSSSTEVMVGANASETTLVSSAKPSAPSKPKREYTYKPEFTGMGALGGMPALGGHMFFEPPSPTESSTRSNSKKNPVDPVGKLVPTQPFKSAPSASFVNERLNTVKARQSFETFTTTVASTSPRSSQEDATSYQRKLPKQPKSFFNNSFSNT
ncbi:hypothetical protein EX895_001691 [Sporisorium graminicola]|uniref:Uncharacterized protein n=1 Tax=Sporisorium graminicola TaxID=280036 RepID=A0A4U7KX86_9BASI|nr:hypothetical protein EX895_001691 [Sporisorium graminicola]TKY89160.1 hypothetical protein EX895_001691 [Sporisorium graminicola]